MLIEALIGILIFSIGILALIGMQAAAIRNTADARYRSEASFLANRSDRPHVDRYRRPRQIRQGLRRGFHAAR